MKNNEIYLDSKSIENYSQQIDIWFKMFNMSREKMELFHDFLISLYSTIEETYLGPDVLEHEDDIKNHFKWCWNKTIDNFNKEKIYFKSDGEHYIYFLIFFMKTFYDIISKNETHKIYDYLHVLFDFKHKKSFTMLDSVKEIYKLLEQNLKK